MKLKIVLAIAVIAVSFTSCKKQQQCPAYGKVMPNAEKVEVKG